MVAGNSGFRVHAATAPKERGAADRVDVEDAPVPEELGEIAAHGGDGRRVRRAQVAMSTPMRSLMAKGGTSIPTQDC